MTDFQYHICLTLNQKTDRIANSKRKRSLLFNIQSVVHGPAWASPGDVLARQPLTPITSLTESKFILTTPPPGDSCAVNV